MTSPDGYDQTPIGRTGPARHEFLTRLAPFAVNPMPKSLQKIQAQIEKLQAQAAALKAQEVQGVIERIRVAIEHYGITTEQLFGKGGAAPKKPTSDVRAAPVRKPRKVADTLPVKYRDGDSTWSGRGNKPRWLVARLAEGKQLTDFAVS